MIADGLVNALLIGLLGTYIHSALTNSLIRILLSDGPREVLKSYAKLFYGNLFAFLLGGQTLHVVRLVASLTGRKAVNGYKNFNILLIIS